MGAKAVTHEEFPKVRDELSERIERLTIRVEVFANDLHKLTQQVGDVAEDLVALRAEMSERLAKLEADVAQLTTDVAVLKLDVAVLKLDVAALKRDMADVKADLAELKRDMATGFAQVLAAISARAS